MKEKLKEFCRGIEIDNIGIAHPGPYLELARILRDRVEKGYYTGMEESDILKRIDPSITMKGVKSIIVCLFPYFNCLIEDTNISKYTYPLDYHMVAGEKLEKIGRFLKNEIQGFEYMCFVDSGPLVDRYLAYEAGIGYFGINTSIITDTYGSYVFIGYIINNYSFEYDSPIKRTCIKCGECVKRCPGSAIIGDFSINPRRCISYITQKKGELTREEAEILKKNKMVFGCDICQDVCPHNKYIDKTNISDFKTNLIFNIDYDELSNISGKEFKRRYGNRAFSWRGKNIILRNFKKLIEKE